MAVSWVLLAALGGFTLLGLLVLVLVLFGVSRSGDADRRDNE